MTTLVQDTETFQAEDQTWMASAHGSTTARPITLDISVFTLALHYPDGFLTSGIVLGEITATGIYGPYESDAVDGRETAVGLLFTSVPTDAVTDPLGALLWEGAIREDRLPVDSSGGDTTVNHGGIDAAGRTDLAGHIKSFDLAF